MRGPSALGVERAVPLDTLRRALAAYAAGRLGEAELCCRLVLAANKNQFDAVHLLGLVELQRGRAEEAHTLIRRALKINPRSAHALCNLGLVLEQLGRLDQALASLGKALSIDADNYLVLNNHGHVLWRLKRAEEAVQSLDRALALNPDYADALCNRGNALVDLKRLDEALASYDRALLINPNDASTLCNRGNVLWALTRHDEALQSYERALAIQPDDLATLKDYGAALLNMRRYENALACFDRALQIKPADAYLIFKRGSALLTLQRLEEALACFDQACAIAPADADGLDDKGNVLAGLHRHAEALASYDQALQIAPDSAKAHWNKALTLLRIGDYEQGWEEHEWRWQLPTAAFRPRGFTQPQWNGELPIAGQSILIHAEQGFGETIQYVRFVPMVAALGAKVILEVQPELKGLVANMDVANVIIAEGEQIPPFDLHCPLASLARAFKTRLDSIPATQYLTAPSERVAAWRERLPCSPMPRVGICWAGNPDFAHDRWRSIGLAPLLPLLQEPRVQFVSLQKVLRTGDEDLLRQHPHVVHIGDQLEDFSDTAAVMSLLDLVVSSDTAPVHLAGALGRPVWILLHHTPDWRWMLERDDNPWYPSARLFRQPTSGDWRGAVERLGEQLGLWSSTFPPKKG